LDGNVAIEGRFERLEHDAHPTPADLVKQDIVAKDFSWLVRRRCCGWQSERGCLVGLHGTLIHGHYPASSTASVIIVAPGPPGCIFGAPPLSARSKPGYTGKRGINPAIRRKTAMSSSRLLADVEAFCQEIRPIEELCYVEHKFNDRVIPLAGK